jgi:sarcosine oxidase
VKNSFDIIVIGVGSMGSSACYYLSKKGYRALGIEQFDIGHELGSHAGQSRIIRKAYFEHPGYVPLLERAYENWKQLVEETGEQLYFKTGLLYAGNPGNVMINGVKESAALYNIALEKLTHTEASQSFHQFSLPEDFEILFEPDAGFLPPEKSIRLYTEQAKKNGATIHLNEKIMSWKKEGNGVTVKTNKNTYNCQKLIITAGAWSGKLIPGFAEKIKATRQFVAWIKPKQRQNYLLNNFPCWMIADDEKQGCYYGFPLLPTEKFGPPEGLKLAHHYPAAVTDPDNVNREATGEDIENLKYCLQNYLPGTFQEVLSSKICLYGNSPDENFIIDKLPGYEENVCIACGFSGHGFKFVSVVGEILADLATEEKTNLPIEFLSAKRFS